MTGQPDRDRRVLAVRCPAWRPPSLVGAGPGARAFEPVVRAIQEFCPRIEVLRPGICAFAVRGPARYFGGEAELGRKIAEAVTRLGLDCGVGVADGMFAALLASRDSLLVSPSDPVTIVPPGGTPAFLAPRAVTVLGEPDLADLLVRLGIRTLGEFAAVPPAEAGNRFGAHGLLAHRLARGLDPRPLSAGPPPADLSVQIEFDPPAEQSERVVFAAKSLAGRLHAQLAASGLACVRVEVEVICDNGDEITRLWRHDGLLSAAGVADRVRWQLDGWRPTPGDRALGDRALGDRAPGDRAADAGQYPEGGVAALRLVPDLLVRAAGQQLALWGETVVSDRVARAAMRVQAMLGHEAVLRPVIGGGRDFAVQVTPVPFGEKTEPRLAADRPWPGRVIGPAPGVVYPAAREAEVTDDAGEIVTVSGRCVVSAAPARLAVPGEPPRRVTGWAGPWPLAERWWDPAAARRRARFQLATDDGRAWLAVVQDGRWLIEAAY
jgi:protein ImuB